MQSIRRRGAKFVAPIAIAIASTLVVGAFASPAQASGAPLVLSSGHIDLLNVHYDSNELALNLKEDITGAHVEHDPADVILQVKEESALVLPTPLSPNLSFLGAGGETVYYLPQSQDPDLIWPGWSTEEVPSGLFTNPLEIRITDVQGPGSIHLWQSGSFGDTVSVLQGGGFTLPGTIRPNVNVHAHANWAFTELGEYKVTAEAFGNRVGSGTSTSESVVYTFVVGDLPQPEPAPALSINGLLAEYEPGDIISLNAVQTPQTSYDHYHWFRKAPGANSFQQVAGANGPTYEFTATEALDGAQVKARLYDDAHGQIAESPAVTVHVHSEPDPGPPAGGLNQTIVATLDANDGSLVANVPNTNNVVLSDAELGVEGDRWVLTGAINPVRVTDTRPGHVGWNVSGQVNNFANAGQSVDGKHLGWTPEVLNQVSGQGVVAGAIVAPGFDSGTGLKSARTLGEATSGNGFGTADLGADLRLEMPTDTTPGTYIATLTLTVI